MAVSANAASFSWGGLDVGELVSIGDFTAERPTIDVSVMGADTHREFIVGKKNSTFTVTVYLSYDAHMATAKILEDWKTATSDTFTLDFADGSVSGSAYVTSFGLSAEQDGASTCTISCQVVSDLTFAATPAP